MRVIKIAGWIVIGAVIGAVASGSIGAVRAQQPSPRQRLLVTGSTYPGTDTFGRRLPPAAYNGSYRFIQDTQTHACWLLLTDPQQGLALSPAPSQACEEPASSPTR